MDVRRREFMADFAAALACGAAVAPGLHAQTAAGSNALDAEYRKFDELCSFLRKRNAQQFAITSAKGIDEAAFVTLGGIEQWITIRGQNRDNPVLLFVHGGPGDVTHHWTFALFGPWLDHFTLVQWDQRGAGRTLKKNGPSIAPTITLDRMTQDGIELAGYLRKYLKKDKIIIVCHSFGSILGLLMARAKPQCFHAYVGTGQVGDSTRNYSVAYDALLAKARSLGNQSAIDDLTRVGPPPYKSGEGFQVQRRWANSFEGADQFLFATLGYGLVAPGYSVEDINDSGDGQILSADQLVPQTKSLTSRDFGLKFSIPIFVFQGAEDFTTPTALAKHYLESLEAPRKKFIPIPDAGHFVVFMRPNQFLAELLKHVAPLAASSSRNS